MAFFLFFLCVSQGHLPLYLRFAQIIEDDVISRALIPSENTLLPQKVTFTGSTD
jgi:hypothetical protein